MKKKTDPRNKGLTEHLTFLVTVEDREWLDEHIAETETPIGAILRRALRMYRESLEK